MADSANSTTASRRLFLASGSIALVCASLKVAAARQPSLVDAYIADMRAVGYRLDPFADTYSVRPAEGRGFGDELYEIGNRYGPARKADPDFHQKVAATLRGEG
jgi:hypothetical protein